VPEGPLPGRAKGRPVLPGKAGEDRGLERLTQPLVRDGGVLRPASWDEALERAAAGFDAARALGPNGFGMFSCSKTTNEMNFMAQKFTRVVMHSNNIDSCNRT
jgi:formate dehydrogenase (hydrogenase)